MVSIAALLFICASPAYAVEDLWTVGREIITDVYSQIAGISTVLAGLMSAVAVLGCKFSGGRQQRVDQSWDWLKRIWIAWAVINGIGAFIAYVAPLFFRVGYPGTRSVIRRENIHAGTHRKGAYSLGL